MVDIISALLFFTNIFSFLFFVTTGCDTTLTNYLNPFIVYEEKKVNWFGAWLISVICNIILMRLAVFYWIYVLCTFGRD
jgi:hypothetical protein